MVKVKKGDKCLYYYPDSGNMSLCLVEILEVRSETVAMIRIDHVFNDQSGNGYFEYLQRIGGKMGASIEYLFPVSNIVQAVEECCKYFNKNGESPW